LWLDLPLFVLTEATFPLERPPQALSSDLMVGNWLSHFAEEGLHTP
jgi:hypothetical protein